MIQTATSRTLLILAIAGGAALAQTDDQIIQQQSNDRSVAMAAYDRQDWQTALPLLARLADAGDVDAQTDLGLMYRDGNGVTRDYAKSDALLQQAADQNDIYATYALGNAYTAGNGVPQDYAQGAKLYSIAADTGYPYAQVDLGYDYEMGQGVPQDYSTSLKWALITRSVVANSQSQYPVDPKEIAFHNNVHITIAISHLNEAQIQNAKNDAIAWLMQRGIAYDDSPLPKPFSYTPYLEAAAAIFGLFLIAKTFQR